MRTESKDPQALWEPITLEQSFPFVAYAIAPAEAPVVCLTAHKDHQRVILDNMTALLGEVLNLASSTFEDWQNVPGIHGHVEPDGEKLHINICQCEESDPELLAEAVLRGIVYHFEHTVDGTLCDIAQYAPDPGEAVCRYDYSLRDRPDQVWHIYLADDPERLDAAIRTLILAGDAAAPFDVGMYALEAGVLGPIGGFTSFHRAIRLATDADKEGLIKIGLALCERLLAAFMWDHADSVASEVVRLAEPRGRSTEMVRALRLQGIAASRLGAVDRAVNSFEGALELSRRLDDPSQEARLRMSFGLSLLDLLAHWEALGPEQRRTCMPQLHERLDLAERELHAARDLFAAFDDERSRRNIRFIDLDLLRVRDLRGDHAGARRELEALESDMVFLDVKALTGADVDAIKHEATRLHYRLAAVIKQSDTDLDTGALTQLIEDVIPETVRRINWIPTKSPINDRLCYVQVIASRIVLQSFLDLRAAGTPLGEACGDWLESIRRNLLTAWRIQRSYEVNNVRPPRSGIEYGGLSAIDVAGMLQQTLLLLADVNGDPELAREAFMVADEAKGRYFRRDLAFCGARTPGRVHAKISESLAELRDALLRGIGDHRIVMAEIDRTLRLDMSDEDAAAYARQIDFDAPLSSDDVKDLLESDEIRSGFLSLYAAANETIVYFMVPGERAPEVTRLIVDVGSVEKAAKRLQSDVRGVNLDDDAQVAPVMDALRQLFKDVMSPILSLSRLVVSLHGPWHGIPMHVALLPMLWQHDRDIGVEYVPSLRAWRLLERRRRAMTPFERRPIGLTTSPATEDRRRYEGTFAAVHRDLFKTLDESGRGVVGRFGSEATLERGLEDLRTCGLLHFLAHGVDAGPDLAMASGLLLANHRGQRPSKSAVSDLAAAAVGPSLASDRWRSVADSEWRDRIRSHLLSAALMTANGTLASHVTLQSCSVGRQGVAFRDELWGVTRALLAAGANTVLAPLWDLDLISSSQVLRSYYAHWLGEGCAPWHALAIAQREMATGDDEAFRHFAHWGTLQLSGC